MPRGRRVDWTETEQDKLYTATVDLLRLKPTMTLLNAVRQIQIGTLEEGRRRNLTAISNLPSYLRNRFITNRLLDPNWDTKRTRSAPPPPGPDPRDLLTEDLKKEISGLRAELQQTYNRIGELERRPTARDEIQEFFAEIYVKALQKARAVPGTSGFTPVPPQQRPPPAQRHNPEPPPAAARIVPDVVLVGVPFDRRTYYERIFNGKARIRYWSEGGNVNTLAEMARRADMTFIRTDIVDAATIEVLKGAADENMQRVPGPEHRIEEELGNWLKRMASQ